MTLSKHIAIVKTKFTRKFDNASTLSFKRRVQRHLQKDLKQIEHALWEESQTWNFKGT